MLLGYDLGSSSIKATLLKSSTGEVIASATYPKQEMQILSKKPGFAEQDPEVWWKNVKSATQEVLIKSRMPKEAIKKGGAEVILPLQKVAQALIQYAQA